MSLRTAAKWFWDCLYEVVVSATLFFIILKFFEVLAFRPDSFATFEIIQLVMWVLFAFAAIICMRNTAICRVAVQEAKARERKGGL